MELDSFGPGDKIHDRVDWPHELRDAEISLPNFFIPLLTFNRPLSTSEVEHVDYFKSPILDKISEFDAQEKSILAKIEDLRHDLERVMLARKPFDKQVAACNVVTSPFRHLPDDILHEIVKHCPPTNVLLNNCPPFHLARVCRQWRRVVLGISSLWRNVHLAWPRYTDAMGQFKHFARLSRSLPLRLRLDERVINAVDFAEEKGALPFLRSIMSDGTTCQRLESLDVFSARNLQIVNAVKVNKLPLLKFYVQIQTTDPLVEDEEFLVLAINQLLANAPNLTHLWFGGTDAMGPLFDLPQEEVGHWSQLTALHYFGPLYLDEWHSLLKICTKLESAWVRVSAPNDIGFDAPDLSLPHDHEHLKKLIIHLVDYDDQILFPFAGFRFPKLKTLQVGFVGASFIHPSHLQPADFVDVFPSLKNLVVIGDSGIEAHFEELFTLLRAVPTTESLLITFGDQYYMEFLEFLREPQEDGRLPLPALRDLEIEFLQSPTNNWNKTIESTLTASLFETCRLRLSNPSNTDPVSSSTPKLHDMAVRYNSKGPDGPQSRIAFETRRRMEYYFSRLKLEVVEMDDINMTVLCDTEGYRDSASPVLREFVHQFAFGRST